MHVQPWAIPAMPHEAQKRKRHEANINQPRLVGANFINKLLSN